MDRLNFCNSSLCSSLCFFNFVWVYASSLLSSATSVWSSTTFQPFSRYRSFQGPRSKKYNPGIVFSPSFNSLFLYTDMTLRHIPFRQSVRSVVDLVVVVGFEPENIYSLQMNKIKTALHPSQFQSHPNSTRTLIYP